jgi:hypothetical protein
VEGLSIVEAGPLVLGSIRILALAIGGMNSDGLSFTSVDGLVANLTSVTRCLLLKDLSPYVCDYGIALNVYIVVHGLYNHMYQIDVIAASPPVSTQRRPLRAPSLPDGCLGLHDRPASAGSLIYLP